MIRPSTRSLSITSQESYSAVIITDVVADVPVSIGTEAKPTKEANNLAYDSYLDGEVTRPTMDDTTQKTNGAGISKGVILNAIQFQNNDSKTKSDEKPIPLTSSLPVPALPQQISEPKGFKDMSLLRKVAFGFSFLPSILFVLCFAVILPCNVPKPCIEEVWTMKFNDTEAKSGIELPANVLFTALQHGNGVLFELDKNNGKLKGRNLTGASTYLKCGKLTNKDEKDCIVGDETGKIYFFNNSHSGVLWDPVSEVDKHSFIPVILSGCKDEMEDVALAVSSTTIKVLYSENEVEISVCDSVPIRLTSWKIKDSSDIIFICEKDGEDKLVRVPLNVWCTEPENPQEKPIVLESGDMDSLKQSVFQPLNEGIVLWTGDKVSMIQPNGTYLWKLSNVSHPEENRFIMYGHFYGESKQVALLSSSLSSGLWITLLDPSDGSFIKFKSHLNSEATEMIHVEGKKKDFVVLLLKKTVMDSVTTALSQIKDISSTIVNLVSNEEVNHVIQPPISEEVALLDLDGDIDNIKAIGCNKDGAHKSTIAAVSHKDSGVLSIYILSTSVDSETKTTEVKNINVANWDKSTKSKCKI